MVALRRRQVMGLAMDRDLDVRDVALLGYATEGAARGLAAQEWLKAVQQHQVFVAWVLEDLRGSERRLRAAGLWPEEWEGAPPLQEGGNADAEGLPDG